MTALSPLAWYRLGSILIWIGVLVWAPYLMLAVFGQAPSLLWFLPFHLLGVIGGAQIRRLARKRMDLPPSRPDIYRILGSVLIAGGVLAWVPYLTIRYGLQQPAQATTYLPFHLLGVLGGVAVLSYGYLRQRRQTPDLR